MLDTPPVSIGQRVRDNEHPEQVGTVRYIGPIKEQTTHYYGIEWDLPVGKYDGEYNGIRYFSCKPLHGSFVQLKRLHLATSLWETILDRYVTGREVKEIDSMYVYGGSQMTQVKFYGQGKIDKRHGHLEALTEIDLQGYNVGHLGTTEDRNSLSRLSSLQRLELSFTLLNDPVSILTLFCLIPSLETILVNGCNVQWNTLFEQKSPMEENTKISLPKKNEEFLLLIQQLRRRTKPFSIYTNSLNEVTKNGFINPWTSALALRALLKLPKLVQLNIDYWTLSPTDIFEQRHRDLLHISAISSFRGALADALVSLARAFPNLESLSLGIDKEPSKKDESLPNVEVASSYHLLHRFMRLKVVNLSYRTIDISIIALLNKLCPALEEIRYGDLYARGETVLCKEQRAYIVALLNPTLKLINWIPLFAEDRRSEERFYVSIWCRRIMSTPDSELRKLWLESPEIPILIQKHKLTLTKNVVERLLRFVPEAASGGIIEVSENEENLDEDKSLDAKKNYRKKLVEITLCREYNHTKRSPEKILLPRSTCIWRMIAILRESYNCNISRGIIASGQSMYGESINDLSLYIPIGDIVAHECRIQV